MFATTLDSSPKPGPLHVERNTDLNQCQPHCNGDMHGWNFLDSMSPKRVCHTLQKCKAEATSEQPAGKPNRNCSPKKIDVTRKLPVGSIPVVTLIRTDTTLDHSQKAEKVLRVFNDADE